MTAVIRTLAIGAGLTAGVTLVLYFAMGRLALVPSLAFGSLATGVQLAAEFVARDGKTAPLDRFLRQRAYGAAIRLAGVVLLPVAVLGWRETFAPVPAAFAFVGVLIPLLFMEIRLAR